MSRFFRLFGRIFFSVLLIALTASASDWRLIGPEGGDVRSFAYDPSNPSRILLGTSAGQLFVSEDSGASWSLFAHLGPGDDYVLDHIIFDPAHPSTIYVAGWSLDNQNEGDVFRSDDGGRSWRALKGVHGKSARALAMAPSNSRILLVGALDGVFRSQDGGENWERISPEGHAEIKNIESLAVDPLDPTIIYAGTWHLPWKTNDGGATWHSISRGIAFDSDIFSIIVDPRNPSTVFASACSGMYKSLNRAELFRRIMGLPHSAIRTRVLKQDPQRSAIVYAGTTGGLWKSVNGGDTWKLVTDDSVVVNDVLVDPVQPNHVLVATDRGGVLASNDGFAHYQASNRGFAHRVVGGVVVDNKDPNRIFVGVVNDKQFGGLFVSNDTGATWKQSNLGMNDRDILSLQQGPEGVVFAGTNHGIFYLVSVGGEWKPAKMIQAPLPASAAKAAWEPSWRPAGRGAKSPQRRKTAAAKKSVGAPEADIPLDRTPRVQAFDLSGDTWYAATTQGLFRSVDHGHKWYGTSVEGESDFIAINTFADGTLSLVTPKRAFLSADQGKTWNEVSYPQYVTGLYNLTKVNDGTLWLATREGALHSADGGKNWDHVLAGLPARNVYVVYSMPGSQRLLATARHAHGVFESNDGGRSWQRSPDTGVSIRAALPYQGRLLAASAYNGLLLQQQTNAGASEAATLQSGGGQNR